MLSSVFLAFSVLGLSSVANGAPTSCSPEVGKAIYFLGNEPKQNTVVAISIGSDGLLSGGTVTPTGGKGSNSLNGEGQPAMPDPLVSQGSLVVVGNLLFAVNAGSDTISLFSISPSNSTKLTLIGQPAHVPGEFPNTIAASLKHKIVCVGTSGKLAGVSCGRFDPHNGIGALDNLRPFELNQSTPPVGPLNTVSHVFFSQDESRLYTTVKGDPNVNNTGFISVFSVKSFGGAATVSKKGIRSSPKGTAVLFGSQVIPGTDDIFATDASFGGAILAVDDATLQVSTSAKGVVDGQMATCWVALAPQTKSAFVTDVASKRLVELSLTDASVVGQLDLSSQTAAGFIDLIASGGLVFVLAANVTPRILVIDVKRGINHASLVQSFDIAKLGAGSNSQGLALHV